MNKALEDFLVQMDCTPDWRSSFTLDEAGDDDLTSLGLSDLVDSDNYTEILDLDTLDFV
jgi:hypothetical protein